MLVSSGTIIKSKNYQLIQYFYILNFLCGLSTAKPLFSEIITIFRSEDNGFAIEMPLKHLKFSSNAL